MTNTKVTNTQRFQLHHTSLTIPHLPVKDPVSAATHGIGALASIIAAPFLITHYIQLGAGTVSIFSICVFLLSMVLLYSASTLYHTIITSPAKTLILKKFDHMMIFILIAGSYTPFCLITLGNRTGLLLLIGVWTFALVGMIFKFFWVTCPKWVSSVIYIAMGWLCIFAIPQFYHALSKEGFFWLLIGGIIYTVGGIVYALKLPIFNSKHKYFGSHEIFHLFVMAGNLCHFIVVYNYLF